MPGLTACRLCSGETLAAVEPADAQLERLRGLERDGVARLTLVDCLDQCERGDVVVARPTAGRRRAAPPVWFERLAGPELTDDLEGWLRDGGPGTPLPAALRRCALERAAVPVEDPAPTS